MIKCPWRRIVHNRSSSLVSRLPIFLGIIFICLAWRGRLSMTLMDHTQLFTATLLCYPRLLWLPSYLISKWNSRVGQQLMLGITVSSVITPLQSGKSSSQIPSPKMASKFNSSQTTTKHCPWMHLWQHYTQTRTEATPSPCPTLPGESIKCGGTVTLISTTWQCSLRTIILSKMQVLYSNSTTSSIEKNIW